MGPLDLRNRGRLLVDQLDRDRVRARADRAHRALPRQFVFRPPDEDLHPMPWLRVSLSCAIGDRLYPDPQWDQLAATWRACTRLPVSAPRIAKTIAQLQSTMPALIHRNLIGEKD